MRKLLIHVTVFVFPVVLFVSSCSTSRDADRLVVPGVKAPVISLNGTWKINMDPPESFWEKGVDFSGWQDIQVPGECQMQGFAIRHDKPVVYKQTFDVPPDYAGRNVVLVFYGVYSYARVWVNGVFIREHYGGFTRWDCDITDHVVAGEKAILTVEVTDRIDDISYASGYAKHQIGGILRDVELMVLPGLNFREFYFETDLDREYRDAELKIFYELSGSAAGDVSVELFDGSNRSVVKAVRENAGQKGEIILGIQDPLKWDAEHPHLYTLETTLSSNGQPILIRRDKMGFREVEVKGNDLLVNGKPVKLRGANRHDIHPLLGRMTTPELDREDVLLAKEANMNFIRTSHYPPSESFLRYCDEYGLYVEDETAVCFVHTHRAENYRAYGASQDDPAFTHRYLSQLKEMVDNHRNHPSVILWSIGNENQFGINFKKSYEWIKNADLTRPVIYSYPGRVPDSLRIYDILSIHYPEWTGDKEQYGFQIRGFEYGPMPALYDEWAHVACYNKPTLQADPNVRNFWGQSLDSIWTNLFEADGGLGGAIWCMIDETFMLPDTLAGFRDWWGWQEGVLDFEGPCVGYGEWGIIDTWRRRKPEFWGTKKAYSPAKILVKEVKEFKAGQAIRLPVHNRFDHTSFNELKIAWSYDGKTGTIEDMDLDPHQKGELEIPGMDWKDGTAIHIAFYLDENSLVDEYNIRLGEREADLPGLQEGYLAVEDTEGGIKLSGEGFNLRITKADGQIRDLSVGGEVLIRSGPHLKLKIPGTRTYGSVETFNDLAGNWECKSVRHEVSEGVATVYAAGSYNGIDASFVYRIDGQGTMLVEYELQNLPEGKYIHEAGMYFITGDSFRELIWDRQAYFTAYPDGDLGHPRGKLDLDYRPSMFYREKPGHGWVDDTRGFYYFGPETALAYTNGARSLKENIYVYGLSTGQGNGIRIQGQGTQACRFDRVDGENLLMVYQLWDYADLMWGNYMKKINLPGNLFSSTTFSLQSNP